MFCVSAWKLLTGNSWVRNVVRFGYKIPLWRQPFQGSVPRNPSVTPEAHKVLEEEAVALLGKGAIRESKDSEPQYVSSYFAVPSLFALSVV